MFSNVFHFTRTQLAIFNLRHNNSYLGRNIHGQSNEREPSPVTRWYLAGSRGLSIPCLLLINHANGQNLDCKCFALQRFYGAFEGGRFKASKMQSLLLKGCNNTCRYSTSSSLVVVIIIILTPYRWAYSPKHQAISCSLRCLWSLLGSQQTSFTFIIMAEQTSGCPE